MVNDWEDDEFENRELDFYDMCSDIHKLFNQSILEDAKRKKEHENNFNLNKKREVKYYNDTSVNFNLLDF